MAENKILQKSLSDLLNDTNLTSKVEILEKSGTTTRLPLSSIKANPFQPRTVFDETALNELALSIKEYGVFSPIIVRKRDGFYEIVAGERRYRASIIAGMKDIPAIIESFSDQEMSEIALIENIQRENLSPLEISKALFDYQQEFNLTQNELADKFGKSRSYIANILRLRQLPKSIQKELEEGRLSVGHVRTLIGLSEEEAQEFLKQIKDKNMNVRETESLVSSIKMNRSNKDKEDQEKRLKEKLHADVKVTRNEIKISYESKEDLEKILKELLGK